MWAKIIHAPLYISVWLTSIVFLLYVVFPIILFAFISFGGFSPSDFAKPYNPSDNLEPLREKYAYSVNTTQ